MSVIIEAVKTLNSGGVVAIPTETVYGLAASLQSPAGIAEVYRLKGRPADHPVIIHIADWQDLYRLAENIPNYVPLLTQHFWPGPLTLILKKSDAVPETVTGGQMTVGIRMPSHPLTLELIRALGCPIIAPSANLFGKLSPTTTEHVQSTFSDNNLMILEGGRCSVGIESTILKACHPTRAQILRPGIITSEAINQAMAYKLIRPKNLPEEPHIKAPGCLKSHYCPNKPVKLIPAGCSMDHDLQKSYFLSFSESSTVSRERVQYVFYMPKHPDQYAYQLYFQLRIADLSDAPWISVELPPKTPEWEAVLERLEKAGALGSLG